MRCDGAHGECFARESVHGESECAPLESRMLRTYGNYRRACGCRCRCECEWELERGNESRGTEPTADTVPT